MPNIKTEKKSQENHFKISNLPKVLSLYFAVRLLWLVLYPKRKMIGLISVARHGFMSFARF